MPRHIVKYVRNQSSGWLPKRVIVVHTSEGPNHKGVSDLYSLAAWFNMRQSQASSHKGIDQEGNKITMVADNRKAWHVGPSNSWCLGVEQIGYASYSKKHWVAEYHNGLVTFAKQIADWSIKHNIPIKHSRWKGVATHHELPGSHYDPGAGYPFEYLLLLATVWKWRKQGTHKRHPAQYKRMVARIKRAQALSGVPAAKRTINWR